MDEKEIYAALGPINRERCTPPKQDNVLRELAAWAARLAPGSGQGASTAPEPINLLSFPLTDSGNAERIVALFGSDIRYCHEMRRFLAWDGCRWNPDDSHLVNYRAKETARLLSAQAGSLPEEQKQQLEYRQAVEKHARKSESAKGRPDALECLSAEQNRIPIHEPQLDPDPLLLNCLSGTIDLRMAKLREHRREDLISKLIPIEYDHERNAQPLCVSSTRLWATRIRMPNLQVRQCSLFSTFRARLDAQQQGSPKRSSSYSTGKVSFR